MEDDELQAIRARRLAELQNNSSSPQKASGGFPGAGSTSGEDAEKKGQMEDMRRNMLYQILDNAARERCNKVTEKQLIDLLAQLNQQDSSANQSRIVYNRKRYDDSDDEYDL
ncbi:hypothetical protein BDB01DRAFT_713215 [Pilobolus umbonatus]|nr:hypothetical protein BDB01DRAFT_713215 [Pilobolus umbonatus]